MLMAAEERWYFTKEQINNSPSRKCGIDAEKELSYRQQSANLIQDMGQRLQVTQLAINTAIVFMHRFFMYQTFKRFHRNSIAPAALFLAAKVEEQPRKLEHVIKVAHYCLHRDQPALDVQSDAYKEKAEELILNENIMLQTLGFDVEIDHPHGHVVRCSDMVHATKDLGQSSYFMATSSLHMTTMCLEYKPTVVACLCIYIVCKWSNYEIVLRSNDAKDWFWYIDQTVTQELLDRLTAEYLHIMGKSPSRMKKVMDSLKHSDTPPGLGSSVPRGPGGRSGGASTSLHIGSGRPLERPKIGSSGKVTPVAAGTTQHASSRSSLNVKEYQERREKERQMRERDKARAGRDNTDRVLGQGVPPWQSVGLPLASEGGLHRQSGLLGEKIPGGHPIPGTQAKVTDRPVPHWTSVLPEPIIPKKRDLRPTELNSRVNSNSDRCSDTAIERTRNSNDILLRNQIATTKQNVFSEGKVNEFVVSLSDSRREASRQDVRSSVLPKRDGGNGFDGNLELKAESISVNNEETPTDNNNSLSRSIKNENVAKDDLMQQMRQTYEPVYTTNDLIRSSGTWEMGDFKEFGGMGDFFFNPSQGLPDDFLDNSDSEGNKPDIAAILESSSLSNLHSAQYFSTANSKSPLVSQAIGIIASNVKSPHGVISAGTDASHLTQNKVPIAPLERNGSSSFVLPSVTGGRGDKPPSPKLIPEFKENKFAGIEQKYSGQMNDLGNFTSIPRADDKFRDYSRESIGKQGRPLNDPNLAVKPGGEVSSHLFPSSTGAIITESPKPVLGGLCGGTDRLKDVGTTVVAPEMARKLERENSHHKHKEKKKHKHKEKDKNKDKDKHKDREQRKKEKKHKKHKERLDQATSGDPEAILAAGLKVKIPKDKLMQTPVSRSLGCGTVTPSHSVTTAGSTNPYGTPGTGSLKLRISKSCLASASSSPVGGSPVGGDLKVKLKNNPLSNHSQLDMEAGSRKRSRASPTEWAASTAKHPRTVDGRSVVHPPPSSQQQKGDTNVAPGW